MPNNLHSVAKTINHNFEKTIESDIKKANENSNNAAYSWLYALKYIKKGLTVTTMPLLFAASGLTTLGVLASFGTIDAFFGGGLTGLAAASTALTLTTASFTAITCFLNDAALTVSVGLATGINSLVDTFIRNPQSADMNSNIEGLVSINPDAQAQAKPIRYFKDFLVASGWLRESNPDQSFLQRFSNTCTNIRL